MATNKDFIVKNGLSVGEDISVSGSVTSHLQFDDGIQLQLGTDGDLLLYHTGGTSYIDSQTINLVVESPMTTIKDGTDTSATFDADGAVVLYNAGNSILTTTATGVDITGNAVLTGELRGPASFVIDPAAVGNNTGEVVIKGDLTVEGTTTTINSTTLTVNDLNITLASGAASASAATGAGITVEGPSGGGAKLEYEVTQDRWNMNKGLELIGSPLVVGTGTTDVGRIENSSGVFSMYAYTTRQIAFGNDTNGEHVRIDTNGQVGIGVNVPTVALDVSGDITATGTITGSDFSGITMGGSLSGSHDDAKVQYGNSFSGTPAQGHFFFDALNQKLKVYTGSAFVDAVPAGGGGGGGSGSSDATATFRKYTYTLTGTTNAISGKEDDEVTTGDFISGRLYEITAVGNTDFTLIGASSNAVGVQFTATDVGGGTTGKAKEVLFYATGGTQNIEVYVNGVKAVEGSSNDYVATTGTSVTFTSNLASGDVVDVQVYELLTNDSYYLKSEVYTQAEVNSQIATGTSSYLPLVGGELTGNLVMSGTSPQLQFETSAAHPNFQIAVQENTSSALEISSGATDADATDDTYVPRLTVMNNGYVGIGLGVGGVPTSQLTVGGNSITTASPTGMFTDMTNGGSIGIRGRSPTIAFDKTGSNASARILLDHGALQFRDGDLDETLPNNSGVTSDLLMVLSHDGKLGIGSSFGSATAPYYSDPYTDLDVAGQIAMSLGNAHAVFSSDASGKIFIKANENCVNAATAIHMQMPLISGSGALEDKLVINHSDISAYKNVLPNANATLDLGSSTLAWRNVYTNDLHLSNEGQEEGNSVDGTKGNWTIQEGEEHLYIINNKSGKKYKFALEEIE